MFIYIFYSPIVFVIALFYYITGSSSPLEAIIFVKGTFLSLLFSSLFFFFSLFFSPPFFLPPLLLLLLLLFFVQIINPNLWRARLMMQYPNIDIQEGRRIRSVRRRLFQDDDDDNETESGRNSRIEDNVANCFFEEARKYRENVRKMLVK